VYRYRWTLACWIAGLPAAAALVAARTQTPTTAPAAAADSFTSLQVAVEDLRNTRGHLRLGVFHEPAGFPRERDRALLWKSLPTDTSPTIFALELPPGRYAIVVLHDENGNKKLDTGLFGIPKEGYGASNNPKPRRRAATFEEAAFELRDEPAELTVSIQYF
jgi:uncharacterized protein (DUF2141 family)